MSDIRELLNRTARSADVPPSPEVVEADVLRGRTAKVRRRNRRILQTSVLGVAAASALTAGLIVAGNQGGPEGTAGPSVAGPAAVSGESSSAKNGIRLVAYTGEQLEGFVVDRVPDGWFLQGSSEYALTIAPEGTDDESPDSFIGKLVVFLLSKSAEQELPDGTPVEVGDNDGVVVRQDGTTTLTYQDGDGHFVQIQSPKVLGWTTEQLVSFAEGVQVTAHAKQTYG